ncbi:hypothetical protein C6P46_001916 [Rhodotorula mucilaginosa]|uniref:Uncharacterized protein n=1 Tax=Rhodotorula mucilaginosa TaxID=5537 RepID=A0A9P6W4W1_RHOMI|nr:hypothetical protein C6P46_001916 [Rhodotorula mucilaginosa]TKA56444.1 hypothetical protein B0A53_02014 [Rhodotorula sp. CCFEE 5036]
MTASDHPAPPQALVEALRRANVPLEAYADACAACDEPCDDDHDDLAYPSGFEVDLESQMLGELKPYGRQIIVSTGKSDWIREVTDDETSIPGLVKAEYDKLQEASDGRSGMLAKLGSKVFGGAGSGVDAKSEAPEDLPGVYPSSAATPPKRSGSSRLSILNGSFISSSHHGHRESVISLPDFKVINEVEASPASIEELVKRYLDPSIGRAGSTLSGELRSWPLPYHCFHHHLERHGLHVDERGDDLAHGPPIEEWEGSDAEKEMRLRETLQGVKTDGGSVGLFKISHIGGHRYAGNVILYFPNGTSVWFGRVTPADVGVIVDRTIMQGKIIPELLRGGLGLTGKNGPHGVLDW